MHRVNGIRRLSGACASALLIAAGAASAQVAKASCRNGNIDRTETGLQGEVTAADAASKAVVNCNVDLLGQYQGEGASWQLTAWKTCAYYDQRKGTNLAHPGTVALDVSDPSHPTPTAYLSDPAMLDPWESLKVNAARQLLAADQGTIGTPGPGFSIYDISGDCRHPVQKSVVNIPAALGHTGQWAPDGNTYYITTVAQNANSMVAVDTKDPSNPKQLATYTPPSDTTPVFHDLEFSSDGKYAYVAGIGGLGGPNPNGLLILDVSAIRDRVGTNPQATLVGKVTWDDGSIIAQNALPVKIAGKQYILFTDEAGVASFSGSCVSGKSGQGFPRLIDVSDPTNPKTVSKLMLEIMEPANCQQSLALKMTSSGSEIFGYSCHYCNVDDVDDAKLAACNCFASGLRLFDIHDPLNPKELGYYKAPPQGTKSLPGSQYASGQAATFVRPIDWASSKPSFPKDRGVSSGDIWTTSQDNGFEVVRYNNGGGGGGCSTGGQSLLGIAVLAMTALVRSSRRRRGDG